MITRIVRLVFGAEIKRLPHGDFRFEATGTFFVWLMLAVFLLGRRFYGD